MGEGGIIGSTRSPAWWVLLAFILFILRASSGWLKRKKADWPKHSMHPVREEDHPGAVSNVLHSGVTSTIRCKIQQRWWNIGSWDWWATWIIYRFIVMLIVFRMSDLIINIHLTGTIRLRMKLIYNNTIDFYLTPNYFQYPMDVWNNI